MRGQAAMEYLMSYGWAILVVLAAIGALAYFGIFDLDRHLDDRCVIAGSFGCAEVKATSDGNLLFVIHNNVGETLSSVNVSFRDAAGGICAHNDVLAIVANQNDTWQFSSTRNGDRLGGAPFGWNCTSYYGRPNGRVSGILEIWYQRAGEQFSHRVMGDVKVEIN